MNVVRYSNLIASLLLHVIVKSAYEIVSCSNFLETGAGSHVFPLYRVEREEAKIMAWENLQKAKAEAAIGELEVSISSPSLSEYLIHYILSFGYAI